ncbi:MAG: glycoside hydrolase family 2 protein [Stenotrophomonas chelatiphaga]
MRISDAWVRFGAVVLACLVPMLAQAGVLQARWEFRLLPGGAQVAAHPEAAGWGAAQVPGSVHTDLLAAGVIRDPYVGAPEAQLQWIGLADWEYRAGFDVDAETLARPHAELVFEGLDTFAEVELNGQPLLRADNAHRTWTARVDGRLQPQGNVLRIVFRSPITQLLPAVQAMPHKIAGNYPSPYGDEPRDAMVGNFVRKPAYHFGWDWGPRYVTAGVWRPVRLETWGAQRVTDLAVRTEALDANLAALTALVEVEHAGADATVPLRLELRDPDGKPVLQVVRDVLLQAGTQTLQVPLQVPQPRRWWPAGQGAQDRYSVKVALGTGDEPALQAGRRIGLRSVELRRDKDAQGGQGFAFVINGRQVFAKGANVIPFDAFPARVDTARLRTILTAARDANMNMLRNWGGGYYEDEAYFELADELGLMVWQDFMFGGGMQPGFDPAFRKNVVAEARDNLRRLRHHPSIVLWCGNNEEETAWKDWGHGRDLEKADPAFAARVWQGYVDLFGHDLRAVVAEHGLGVPYWSSSPSNDLDDKANDSTRGDKHYWQVWGNPALPVSAYLKETPRFMSEYGLQSWPSQAMVDRFATRAEQRIDSPVIQAHQKFMAGLGNERLLHYIRLGYGEPADFPGFLYLSQVMQAEGIQLAALHHRASRPYTMGSLYWQLNDVWPGASWSGMDHDGNWKGLHFQARRFFADLAVAALREEGVTRVSLLNDTPQAQSVRWRLRVMDLQGRLLGTQEQALVLAPGSATEVGHFSDARLLGAADPARTIAVVDMRQGERELSRQVVGFVEARAQALQSGQLQASLQGEGDARDVVLQAQGLVRAAWIDFGANEVLLEDNLLDLLPGERRVLRVRSGTDAETLRAAMRVQTLGDVLAGTR